MENQNKRLVKIQAGYQNYEWGKIGESSKVYEIMKSQNNNLQSTLPYAELWMGTHVNCPSYAINENNEKQQLGELISTDVDFYLGKTIKEKYNLSDQLPYLFKVLSVNKALSIQAHPDLALAQQLFKQYPNIYKDGNHKPEMCIALSEYEALCNFCKPKEIIDNLQNTPELRNIINNDSLIDSFIQTSSKEDLKRIFTALFDASQELIDIQTQNLIERISKKESLNERDNLVIKLNQQYKNDVGIFVSYLLNYFKMKEGDCLVMGANEPHAYISGDCIECMAASDNVVRAGLTPKFKDKVTLCNMLTYEMKDPDILIQKVIQEGDNQQNLVELYSPENYKDFSCIRIQIKEGDQKNELKLESGSIFLVVNGSGEVKVENHESQKINKGDTYFIAANSSFSFTHANNLNLFVCSAKS